MESAVALFDQMLSHAKRGACLVWPLGKGLKAKQLREIRLEGEIV